MDGGDNTYHPRCLDCGCTAPFDAWQSRTPVPAEVERLVEDLIGWAEIAGVDKYNGVEYMNNSIQSMLKAKSRLLAALSNTTPYLSQDVNVPVVELKDAAHRLAMYVLQSEAYQRDMDTRDAVNGVLALVMPKKAGE